MTSLADVNTFADAILTEVFDHARISRDHNPDYMRSVVFTSYNANICIALNWKQPNCELSMPLQASFRSNMANVHFLSQTPSFFAMILAKSATWPVTLSLCQTLTVVVELLCPSRNLRG